MGKDGKSDVETITKRIEVKLGAPIEKDLILFALSQLNNEGLLINCDFPDGFGGISRREVVKKIGFASMVAMPIVTAIVAPRAT